MVFRIIIIVLSFTSLALVIFNFSDLKQRYKNYFRFLFTPWKVITFVLATLGITLVAPYTGDPTWDYGVSIIMSVMTYLSAPWVCGVTYRFFNRRSSFYDLIIAIAMWLLSASLSYDLYNYFKLGFFPDSSLANLSISTGLYFLGGLFWNLTTLLNQWPTLAFLKESWPDKNIKLNYRSLLIVGLPFMILATITILFFVYNN